MAAILLSYPSQQGILDTTLNKSVQRLTQAYLNQQQGKVIDVVIVGGGAAGVAAASSILSRTKALSIAIIEPSGTHYYQPGWTMVGAGVFDKEQTKRAYARGYA